MPIMNYKTFYDYPPMGMSKTIDNIIIKKTALYDKCNFVSTL